MTTTSRRPREAGGENDHHDGEHDVADPYFSTLESVMRISLAGFGGALVGLSLSRRRGVGLGANIVVPPRPSSSVARGAANAASATTGTSTSKGIGIITASSNVTKNAGSGKRRLQRQQMIVRTTPPSSATTNNDRELPTAWAVACMAFAGVVEFTRMLSPSMTIRDLVVGGTINDENDDHDHTPPVMDRQQQPSLTTATTTRGYFLDTSTACAVSDYAIGGAVAGAIFRGSAVRTRAMARLNASSSSAAVGGMGRRALLSGTLPGAALGLSAGIVIVALDLMREFLDERFGGRDYEDDAMADDVREGLSYAEDGGGIPVDIKMMSNEELAESIERLRGHQDGGGGSLTTTATTQTMLSLSAMNEAEPSGSIVVEATTDDHGNVRDLFSALGFRPHPSRHVD
jgi:hypothetical protein